MYVPISVSPSVRSRSLTSPFSSASLQRIWRHLEDRSWHGVKILSIRPDLSPWGSPYPWSGPADSSRAAPILIDTLELESPVPDLVSSAFFRVLSPARVRLGFLGRRSSFSLFTVFEHLFNPSAFDRLTVKALEFRNVWPAEYALFYQPLPSPALAAVDEEAFPHLKKITLVCSPSHSIAEVEKSLINLWRLAAKGDARWTEVGLARLLFLVTIRSEKDHERAVALNDPATGTFPTERDRADLVPSRLPEWMEWVPLADNARGPEHLRYEGPDLPHRLEGA